MEKFYQEHVKRLGMTDSMSQMERDKTLFKNHRYVFYATDITFQQANHPTETHQKPKKCFSIKQKMYGYNTEVLAIRNGIAVACSVPDPGLVSDLTMFRNMDRFHRSTIKKSGHDCRILDHNPLRTLYSMN